MSSSEILESRSYHAGEVCFSPAYQNGMQRQRGFLLWRCLANEMYISGNKKQRKCAIKIKNALMAKYGGDIGLVRRLVKTSCCHTIQVSSFTEM